MKLARKNGPEQTPFLKDGVCSEPQTVFILINKTRKGRFGLQARKEALQKIPGAEQAGWH